ncbi:MAG TPA: efflux RND transporter periplasmic adaptor subunit [Anaerolineae bacterium]|nr:efflux RND transporter periplasmic adaptor subunit [Anaerolineae bacterium]
MKAVNLMRIVVISMLIAACEESTAAQREIQPAPAASPGIAPDTVSASGKVMPERWAVLSFQVSGAVKAVLAQPGDVVHTGDVLVRLDDVDAQMALAQAEAGLALAQAQLAQQTASPRSEQIAIAEQAVQSAEAELRAASAQLAQAQAGPPAAEIAAAQAALAAAARDLKVAQDTYDRVKDIGGTPEEQARAALEAARQAHRAAQERVNQLISGAAENELNALRAQVTAAQAKRDAARAQVELLQAGSSEEELSVAQATVAQAQVAVDAAQARLSRLQIVAPFDGSVGAVSVRAGELAAPGQPVVTLGDLNRLHVETTDLNEIDIARVREGQTALVTFDALPGMALTGTVTRISPMSTPGQGTANFTVWIELAATDPALRWGMTAFVEISTEP